MDKRLKKWFKKVHIGRSTVLAVIFTVLAFVLIHRLYNLQIINGAEYRSNFSLKTTKTRTIKSTRGNIYDRNGNILASNELSYSVTLEDSGSYSSNREKALSLNGEAYRISKILEANGDSLNNDFHIVVGSDGNYAFDTSGTSLSRFKADVYGYAKIEELTDAEANASADEMMQYLVSEKSFAVTRTEKPYTDEELTSHGLPSELTKQETLDIVFVRYQLFTTSYRKYVPVTIATSVSNESVAAITEQKDTLTGIDIVEDTVRVYDNAECFASIIGYTGKVSSEDLAELQAQNSSYSSSSIVGKSGIEKIMETSLQGFDGQETVYVDNLGKVLKVDEASKVEPTAGNDVYLTIDKNLQIATYKMLEQRIAGILESVIVDQKEFTTTSTDTADIRIPVYKVYNAIIENGVIDTTHFTSADASANEKLLEQAFEQKQSEVFASLNDQLTGSDPLPYNQLDDEMKEYETYIVNDLLMSNTGILSSSAIDKTDSTYLAWTRDESISLQQYLTYAASKNWIDISAFATDNTYLDSSEIYSKLSDYIEKYLSTDLAFGKKLYKYLLYADRIDANEIVNVLYDQGIFSKDDGQYQDYENQRITSFNLIISKIHNLILTPAMLALDPCSGSAVITNPKTGEILACVTYPGYDNNRLSNKMDVTYYNKLAADESGPFYNKATQQKTAPGSTFKLITTTAGLEEGVIDSNTIFNCTGVFNLTDTPLNCWLKTGHGPLNIVGAIQNSCNVFFCNVAYKLGINEEGNWSDSLSLGKLQSYAKMYSMDKASGIEIPEADPQISDQYAIPSAIGQGTHSYTTTQLARYVSTLANSGTSYNISLLDKVTDTDSNLIKDYTPSVAGTVSISSNTWDIIHTGMRAVIESKGEYADLPIAVAGKTGTAQESKSRPSHALFICYAPYDDPTIAMAIRIGNGYSSTNAILAGKDIIQYYFNLVDESQLITGTARTDSVSSAQVD
ncbi:MAG TPA: penicillin-binding transpeptidase domain-containing protein [Lachnospiraceae bacterium]|nr:penicillin-binding transpeptidase domain-containing protein [Lachnospiraceae bacterium]